MNYLIAVTIRNLAGNRERPLYRVPVDAPLIEVVQLAVHRTEMLGRVWCKEVEILGTIEPHLYSNYVPLFASADVTDLTERIP